MEKTAAPSRLWTPDYFRIFTTNLLLMLVNNMLPSIFSLFLLDRGGTDFDIGLAAYLYSFSALFMRPLAGWLLDHRSRKWVVLICVAGQIVVPWFYLCTPVIALLLVNRAIHGAFYAASSTGVTTNAYDTLDVEHFNEGVGYFGFSNAIATAIGPGMGLYIYRHFGAPFLFAALALFALIALLLLRGFHFEELGHTEKFSLHSDGSFLDFMLERRAVPASLMTGLVAVYSGASSAYLVLFTEQAGVASPGLYFTAQAAGTFLSRFFVGKISDEYGEAPLVFSSTVLFIGGVAAVVFSPTAWLFYLGAAMIGVAYGFTVTGMQIMSVRIVPPERRGSAASTYSCAWDIFAALGGLLSGILVSYMPYRTMFCVMAGVFPIFLLTYLLFVSKHPSAFRNWRAAHMG